MTFLGTVPINIESDVADAKVLTPAGQPPFLTIGCIHFAAENVRDIDAFANKVIDWLADYRAWELARIQEEVANERP